jgi:hypothetical protein
MRNGRLGPYPDIQNQPLPAYGAWGQFQMVKILRFYRLCLKEAWSGLFDQANAWATVLGAIVIYVALRLLGYRMILPETFEEVIGLAILSLVAAGAALFVVRLLAAPARLYLRAKSEVELLKDELHKRADDPAVEAQRQHTAAVVAHTEALKTKPQIGTPTAGGSTIVLAGIVNTLMDRALQHGFKIAALGPSDPFSQLYEDVKNSIDPVWIDDEINQLRRDFLQYCAIVGFKEHDHLKEIQSDRAELRGYGLKLIASLTGTATISPDIWKAAPDAVAAFADPDLIAERDKWKQTFEDAILRGYEALSCCRFDGRLVKLIPPCARTQQG